MTGNAIPISPELALVDPELAAAARAFLPDAGDCLAPRARLPLLRPVPSVARVGDPDGSGQARHRRRLAPRSALTAATWILVAGILASPLLAFLPPMSAPTVLDDVAPLPHPVAEPGGATLAWQPVRGATIYNLILVDGPRRIDLWATRSHKVVRSREQQDRASVMYSWYVYPGFAVGSGGLRYGALIARGSIAISGELRSEHRPTR